MKKKKNHLFKYTRKKKYVYMGKKPLALENSPIFHLNFKGTGNPLRLKKKKNDCKINNVKRDKEIENSIRKKGKIQLSKLKNVKRFV